MYYMDPALKTLLGSPSHVDDLLPPTFREKHKRLVFRFVGGDPLPDSLNHPLRNVEMLSGDRETFKAKLIIGKFKFYDFFLTDLFYVIVQPNDLAALSPRRSMEKRKTPALRRSSYSHSPTISFNNAEPIGISEKETWKMEKDIQNSVFRPIYINDSDSADALHANESSTPTTIDESKGMVEVYGLGAASYIDRGLVPATERYAQATVLYMDIVDFTRHCMAKQLDEISGWMTNIHTTVDELLARYAIRKVETRGDCVICVSGTNFVPSEGGASRDLCGDQATRMLSFGHDLGLALSAIEGTAARMGMATGPVVLTHIAHGGDALPAKYIYGDTVNVACRMEQTGRVGAVQLAESAARAYAEERGEAVPALRTKQIKGKGPMRTAFYDYVASRFADAEEEWPGGTPAVETPGGC